MRITTIMLMAAAFLALTGLFLKPWFGQDPVSANITRGEGATHFVETGGDPGAEVRSTGIDIDSPPHLNVSKSVSDKVFWRRGDTRGPQNTTVSIHVTGEGNPATDFNSQDVIFTIDCSDSMKEADDKFTRREAAQSYLGKLIPPDRAAVISFSDSAKLLEGHHLSSDYNRIITNLYNLTNFDKTNFAAAIELTNKEFMDYGDSNNSWICILLTDGKPDPLGDNVTLDVINETIANNITIHTIGLYKYGSPTAIDEDLLRWIARKTGGEYFIAESADDLIPIYDDIAMRFRNYTAGYDPDISDDEPMVRDVLPNDFHYDNDSFSIFPDSIYTTVEGMTVLEWNIPNVTIGEEIIISYNVSSDVEGRNVALHPYGDSRVLYYLDGKEYEVHFPSILLVVRSSLGTVASPPPPPPPTPPPPPPPPPGGYPIPVTTPASPTVIPLTTPAGLPAAASPVIFPVEYLVGGFIGLGILERIKLKKRLLSRQKVAVGT